MKPSITPAVRFTAPPNTEQRLELGGAALARRIRNDLITAEGKGFYGIRLQVSEYMFALKLAGRLFPELRDEPPAGSDTRAMLALSACRYAKQLDRTIHDGEPSRLISPDVRTYANIEANFTGLMNDEIDFGLSHPRLVEQARANRQLLPAPESVAGRVVLIGLAALERQHFEQMIDDNVARRELRQTGHFPA